MNLATMETALSEIRGELYGDRTKPTGLVARVAGIEAYIAEQKTNRLLLITIAIGIAADLLVNLLT